MKCPHCDEEFGAEMVAKLAKESRMSVMLAPKPGEYISARTLGDFITNIEKLLAAVGREIGVKKTLVMVERVATNEDGTHEVHFIIVRNDKRLDAA